MGSVGPNDDDDGIPLSAFVPKQVTPEEHLEAKKKITPDKGRPVTSVIDIIEDNEKLEFVIDGVLPDTGLIYIGGQSGTGKTILAIQLAGNVVLGRPTMTWQLGSAWRDDFTVLMLSLEMGKKELQLRLQHMYPKLTEEERKEFLGRFLCYSDPDPIQLWNPAHILELFRMIRTNNVSMLLIDSASVSFAQSLKDDSQVNESINNLYLIRNKLNISMVIVAHTRKPDRNIASNPEDVTLNELFGHSGVAQSASSIYIMLEDEKSRKAAIKDVNQNGVEKLVHIINAKSRFGANSGAFKSYLTSKSDVDKGAPLMFKRNAIPIEMTETQRAKLKSIRPTLGETLTGIDFGSSLDGDE